MVFMNCRAIFNEIYRAYLGALIKTEWKGAAYYQDLKTRNRDHRDLQQNRGNKFAAEGEWVSGI